MSYKDVDHITIDGVSHAVSKDAEGVYRVKLNPKDKGINILQVQSAKIENKDFQIGRPLPYTYEYERPEAIDVQDIEEDGVNAIVKYKLKDNEHALRKLTAYMKTSSGAVVATKEITDYVADNQTENKVEIPLLKLNRYSIELKATIDIGDGNTLEDIQLFERAKDSPYKLQLLEIQ